MEVEKESLAEYVVMPRGYEKSFIVWWRSLESSAKLVVHYPHERHGHAGKTSNSAKPSVLADFFNFVDNSQPNGRSAESHGPTRYFISKFTTLQTPKPTVHNYAERLKRSVVGESNRVQREMNKGECSNGSAFNWLHEHRPKLAICPHKQDYCDTCSKFDADILLKRMTLNRLKQSGAGS